MVNCMTVLLGIGMVVVFIHDMVVPAAWLLPTDIRASLLLPVPGWVLVLVVVAALLYVADFQTREQVRRAIADHARETKRG